MMDAAACREALIQMQEYTEDVSKFLGVDPVGKSKNSYGPFADNQPTGAVNHYTASNRAVGPKRPYGRLPVIMERFKPNGSQGVGVQFVVWDDVVPRFDEMRRRYPLISSVPSEMLCFGFDEAYWQAGWANRWSYGIEIRNIGKLQRQSGGAFYWNGGQVRYRSRTPIRVGNSYWEPYTWSQMVGALWIHRLMATIYDIQPERFIGHVHLTSTRIDPGPHFPIHEMREFALFKQDWPLLQAPFLQEFARRRDDGGEAIAAPDDPLVSEDSLHKGLYRHDWDGEPGENDDFDPVPMVRRPGAVESAQSLLDNKDDVLWAKRQLRSVGYYIGDLDGYPNAAFLESLRIFQARWKKGKKGKPNMVQAMDVTGTLDKKTVKLIQQFVKQQDVL
jgi:hypothetical protein